MILYLDASARAKKYIIRQGHGSAIFGLVHANML